MNWVEIIQGVTKNTLYMKVGQFAKWSKAAIYGEDFTNIYNAS